MDAKLSRAFLGREDPELEELLARALTDARARWPGLGIDDQDFMAFLAARIPSGQPDLAAALAALHVSDLYLACGCARGAPAAVKAFVGGYLAVVPRYLSHIDPSAWMAEEVRQELSKKLLVAAPPDPPRIATYGGRGPLEGWVAVAAQRVALSILRRQDGAAAPAGSSQSRIVAAISGGMDPELRLLKAEVKHDFEQALVRALAGLSSRDRMLLRLSLVSGLSYQKIGKIYAVNASTVARWIARARDEVLSSIESHLAHTRKLKPGDLQSLLGIARSQIELSLSGILADEEPPTTPER